MNWKWPAHRIASHIVVERGDPLDGKVVLRDGDTVHNLRAVRHVVVVGLVGLESEHLAEEDSASGAFRICVVAPRESRGSASLHGDLKR